MPASAQRFHWVYAAKFLCGEIKPAEPEREGPPPMLRLVEPSAPLN